VKLALELPSNTLTVPGNVSSAATRSGRPSRFTSDTATDRAPEPAAKVCWGRKAPFPMPSSTLTVLSLRLATTKSGRPSPFTSDTATDRGPVPVAMVRCVWKVPSPAPSRIPTVLLS